MRRLVCLVIFWLSFLTTFSQPIFGTTGLLNTPSGDMQKDGTFRFGANYLPVEITPAEWNYNTGNYFLNITFLPFLEISYRMTLLKLFEQERFNNQDRSISMRLRLLQEKSKLPSFVIGLNDFYSSTTGISKVRYFSNLYLVSTKSLRLGTNTISATLGYYPQFFSNTANAGIFSGISYASSYVPNFRLIAEYDTKNFNTGASLLLFNHLNLFGMIHEMKRFAGGFSLLFTLNH